VAIKGQERSIVVTWTAHPAKKNNQKMLALEGWIRTFRDTCPLLWSSGPCIRYRYGPAKTLVSFYTSHRIPPYLTPTIWTVPFPRSLFLRNLSVPRDRKNKQCAFSHLVTISVCLFRKWSCIGGRVDNSLQSPLARNWIGRDSWNKLMYVSCLFWSLPKSCIFSPTPHSLHGYLGFPLHRFFFFCKGHLSLWMPQLHMYPQSLSTSFTAVPTSSVQSLGIYKCSMPKKGSQFSCWLDAMLCMPQALALSTHFMLLFEVFVDQCKISFKDWKWRKIIIKKRYVHK
jgi:hypothetical protein